MKATIKKTMAKGLKETEFHTDDLYKFYDFENDRIGNILISAGIVTDLYLKKIRSIDDVKLAKEVVQFAEKYGFEEEKDYNWNLYIQNGEIDIRIGYILKKIIWNKDEYIKYLDKIEKDGIPSNIEFTY